MTVIAAFQDHAGRVAIGCDQGVTTGDAQHLVATKLTCIRHEKTGAPWWVGGTGRGSYATFLSQASPAASPARLAVGWLDWSREHGHAGSEDGAVSMLGRLLGASADGVWTIDGAGCVDDPLDGYHAIGSGGTVALGVLHAARQLGLDAGQAVELAVRAAIAHDPYCAGAPVVQVCGP